MVVDLKMPGIDGLEVLKQVKQNVKLQGSNWRTSSPRKSRSIANESSKFHPLIQKKKQKNVKINNEKCVS